MMLNVILIQMKYPAGKCSGLPEEACLSALILLKGNDQINPCKNCILQAQT